MVACNDEDSRAEFIDGRHERVEFFDPSNFFIEIAIFTGAIGVFEVDEEEVVFLPVVA